MDSSIIFLLIGIAHGLFYATWGRQIFEYKAAEGYDDTYNKIAKNIKAGPISWRIELFLHRFIGVFIGWLILWFLLDKKLHAFSGFNDTKLRLEDLFLFLLGFIGINGRLPSIPHTIEKWFGLTRNNNID